MSYRLPESALRDSCLSLSKEGDFYRLVWTCSVRKPGFVSADDLPADDLPADDLPADDLSADDLSAVGRFGSSISRTKSLVRQYGRCNDWDYFVTLTISPDLWDRFDLRTFYKSFSKYINNLNYRRKDNKKLLYLLIPEQHKSGAWHMHGLMKDIPFDWYVPFSLDDHIPNDIRRLLLKGEPVGRVLDIQKKFGFNTFSPVRSHDAISLYITKYITKNALTSELPRGYRFLLCSMGLKKGKLLRRVFGVGINQLTSFHWDYMSPDCCILTIKPGDFGVNEEKWLVDCDAIFNTLEGMCNEG